MVTLRDIATEAKVSIHTVQRVLSGKNKSLRPTSIVTANRVHDAAKKMRYLPNSAAKSIRRKSLKTIGILISNTADRPLHNYASYETLLGANWKLDQAGYSTVFLRVDDVLDETGGKHRVFKERLFDGLIVLDGLPEIARQKVRNLFPNCIWVENNEWDTHNCLRRDEMYVGRLVVRHVAKAGYRHVIYLCLKQPESQSDKKERKIHFSEHERVKGVLEGVMRHCLTCDIVEIELEPSFGDMVSQVVDRLDRQTAVITYGDGYALQVLHTAYKVGKRAGIDFGLASCDENYVQKINWAPLSRVANDRYAMGIKAAEMLLELFESDLQQVSSELLKYDWVDGETLKVKEILNKE